VASDHASRDRVAALTASPTPSVPPDAPTGGDRAPEAPDPEFWGHEPRAVRRSRRAVADEPPVALPRWWSALVDRARDARLEVGIGVVVVALVAVVAGVVWYRMGVAGGDAPAAGASARVSERTRAGSRAPATPPSTVRVPTGATVVTPTTAAAVTTRGAKVVVHVAGAVAKPGVLLMPAGARVIDAVEGAGGAAPDADLDRLNLAAKLVDGQRILVARVGAPVATDPGGTSAGGPASGDPAALIDLNAATSAQLEELPGIGPALAAAILAERDRRGGFRSVNELREVRGIGEGRFADLRDRVTV
jgi:competence protein ComEA